MHNPHNNRGGRRGGHPGHPPHYNRPSQDQNMSYSSHPPPPLLPPSHMYPPTHQMPAPVQITLTLNSNQLSQFVPTHSQPHPSHYFSDRPPSYDQPPSYRTPSGPPTRYPPPSQQRPYEHNPPPPYSQHEMKSPLLQNPTAYNKADVLANYPPDLQSRVKGKEPSHSYPHHHQHEKEKGKSHSAKQKGFRRTSPDPSDKMPLGCEASRYQQNKKRDFVDRTDSKDDQRDDSSVQSMPCGARGSMKNALRGNRRGRRGQRGASRRGGQGYRGKTSKTDCSNLGSGGLGNDDDDDDEEEESDVASMQSMPVTSRYQRKIKEKQSIADFGYKHHKVEKSDIDDDSRVQDMPFGARGAMKNSSRGNRGQRGANRRGGTSTRGKTSKTSDLSNVFDDDDDDDEEEEGDVAIARSMTTTSRGKVNNFSRGNVRGQGRGGLNKGGRGGLNTGGHGGLNTGGRGGLNTGGRGGLNTGGHGGLNTGGRGGLNTGGRGGLNTGGRGGLNSREKTSKTHAQANVSEDIERGDDKSEENKERSEIKGKERAKRNRNKKMNNENNPSRKQKESFGRAEPPSGKLFVTLKIKSVFDDVDTLKSTVMDACVFPVNAIFHLEFTSETTLYKANLSTCCFVLETSDIGLAKRCLKNMVKILRMKLETYVAYTFTLSKKRTDSDRPSKYKNGVKNYKSDKTPKVDKNPEDCKVSRHNNSDKVKTDTESCSDQQDPVKVKVTVSLSMEKPFVKAERFISFVKTLIRSSIEDFKLNEGSVSLSETKSECSIDLQSKADAKRLKKTLDKFHKESNVAVHCSVSKVPEAVEDDETEIKIWNSKINEILVKMEKKKEEVLHKHEEKISCFRSQFELAEQDHVDGKEELDAVKDKLTEALRQKNEFLSRCERLSKKIQLMRMAKSSMHDLNKIQYDFGIESKRLTNALPIYARRDDIISHVKNNQVSIILGETGSGKSTQMAQYLYEAGHTSDGIIVCTQPRKVAAVQLAERVAQEMTVRNGDLVGFKAGNKRKVKGETKIVFMTDHALLNECLDDRDFNKYSCIIVDEAHERSIYTDILLGMIKACLQRRPDLRVIVTSATIDPQVFIDYFQCPKELRVSGRTYPVDVVYVDSADDFENYESKAVLKAAEIHRNEPLGDVLVFLSSPVEIMRCCEEFSNIFEGRNDFQCLPLHGQLSPEEQKKVFAKLAEGVRKIVFSTNCAETSITIDGIKYVIDSGVSKEMRYDPKKNLSLLGVHVISQSSADQRKGRAGRTASGRCYRLFSEEGYNAMASTNEPEILRVHLGQAVLKLAELGVNICDYDFVKAPSDTALLAALDTLNYLGAIDDAKITDVGRWISKLPFDPKLGFLVYEASKEDLIYDAIVLAAMISNGSSLFYRGLTETEAQISARSKSQFGIESGDIFTWYMIYQTWMALPRNEKHNWCRSNCLNYKCLNYAKQCVDEVINIMSSDLKLNVVKQFSNDDFAESILKKLVFTANARSVCHFLGHSRAGYFSLVSERQVYLHPSCTLCAQNLQPEWLVFTELVKTSREFIKGVLAVDEEWIYEAVDSGKLNINIAQAKQQRLSVVHKEMIGPSVFRNLVGPRFSNLHLMEDECEKLGMQHTIIEADRDLGTLTFYSSSQMHPEIVNGLNEMKTATVKKLQWDERECHVFNKKSNDSPNIRVVLGNGACVRQVLMPHQTNQVLIRKAEDKTEEEILLKFSEFGNVLDVICFKAPEPWGFIRYGSLVDAATAVERTRNDQSMIGSLRLEKGSKNSKNMFEAKVSWLRRPVKGTGTAFIKCCPMEKPSLIGRQIIVNGAFQKIQLSKRGRETRADSGDGEQDLIVFKIGNATEEEIRHELQVTTGRNIEVKITIPRIKVPAPSPREMEEIKQKLRSLVDPRDELKKEDFYIWLKKPRDENIYQIAFLNFTDPVRGLGICKRLKGRLQMDDQMVDIAPCLKTMILVPKRIKEACKEQMDGLFTDMKQDIGVELEWKKMKDDHAITVKSEVPDGIVKARECIMKELQGDVIDCDKVPTCQCLLSKAGQHHLKQVQTSTGCLIVSDMRTKKIHMYGKSHKVSQAMIEINVYLTQNESKTEKLFKLKGFGKPPGFMKEMMNKFGPLLDGLTREYNLGSISVDWKTHTLRCAGADADIDRLQKYISTLEGALFHAKLGKQNTSNNFPECAVCLEPLESKEMLYRLEACGHAYCLNCLQHQSVVCVQSNQFPLVCAEEECGTELVWRDVQFILMKKWIQEGKLVNSSLNSCVSLYPDKYKFCPTPNCPVVYEVTQDKNGCDFNCAACFASTCSSCHVAFHIGVSCEMAKSASETEKELAQWCNVDPEKRKICPGCKSPVEKIEGCNKMICSSCRTIFCWLCCKSFDDSQLCYAHLAKVHGGFY